jgi:hypothetical protein
LYKVQELEDGYTLWKREVGGYIVLTKDELVSYKVNTKSKLFNKTNDLSKVWNESFPVLHFKSGRSYISILGVFNLESMYNDELALLIKRYEMDIHHSGRPLSYEESYVVVTCFIKLIDTGEVRFRDYNFNLNKLEQVDEIPDLFSEFLDIIDSDIVGKNTRMGYYYTESLKSIRLNSEKSSNGGREFRINLNYGELKSLPIRNKLESNSDEFKNELRKLKEESNISGKSFFDSFYEGHESLIIKQILYEKICEENL